MTITALSPFPITASVRSRYLIATGHAATPTVTVSAAFEPADSRNAECPIVARRAKAFQSKIIIACLLALLTTPPVTAFAAAITTYHYNNLRTGWDRAETVLTPANVGSLKLLTTVPLDEQVDAQPLFVPSVTIAGGKHPVIYVATENDTIYAFDAATGRILVKRNFGQPLPISALSTCNNNSAVVGIDSTPVIDPKSQTLYVMIYTYKKGAAVYRLHALDLATLQDRASSPVAVQATAALWDGSDWSFEPGASRQRSALLAANGKIYAGFSSFCDFDANISRGWLLGWHAGSLTPLAANQLNNKLIPGNGSKGPGLSPENYFLSSIWMSGYGIAADGFGHLFFATGNSDPGGTTYSPTENLSESIVKMSGDLTKVLSYFTPSGSLGVSYLDKIDGDFGSGGVLLLPRQPGSYPFLATAAGKAGKMYLLNTANLGGHHRPNHVLGTYSINQCWCGESYFTAGWDGVGRVVSSGGNQIIIWRLETSPTVRLVEDSVSPLLPSPVQNGGFFTTVSSNGKKNAIIWAIGHPVDQSPAHVTLYAFDPNPNDHNSDWLFSGVAGTWPNVTANANIVPVIADGRVYVASYKRLAIFGLPRAGAIAPAVAVLEQWSTPPALPQLPPGSHEISGTIEAVAGDDIILATRAGKRIRVGAGGAVHRHLSVGLLSGEPVTVFGRFEASGVLHAASVLHAKPSPKGWPADR